jgi:ABC-2 type transport system ATP-binding protein
MPQYAIRTENLSRDFDTLRAVNNVSIEVPTGSVFGFLGPNGAGKTTTIRLLLGLLEPSHGRAEVLGFDTRERADEIRRNCGALLEHSGLYERLSAEDNLKFYGRIWHLAPDVLEGRIQELLEHMDLWERRKEPVGTWSRGMRQKLAIARTLLHRPSLIFMDEPTAGLDPIAASSVREDLASLARQEGVTIFLTTHNLTEAEKLCGLVCVIRDGKVLALGHPDELGALRSTPSVTIIGCGFTEGLLSSLHQREEVASAEIQNGRLIIRLHASENTAPLISFIVAEGVEVEEVRKETASLEEVFLLLMQEEAQ